MSDEQTSTTPAWEPPGDENIAAMSSQQAAAKLAEVGQKEGFRTKLLSGDGAATRYFHQLAEKRSQDATAESLINAAADPNAPQPFAGGVLRNGVSKADEIAGARDMLATGASIEELAEFEVGAAMVSPEDFHTIERSVRARALGNPEFVKRYLAGDSEARAIMDRWHRIATLSRPLPPAPTTGIAR